MRKSLVVLFLLLPGWLGAQLAVVSDPDGYTNVRSGPGKEYSVLDTLRSGRLVMVVGRSNDWLNVQRDSPRDDRDYGDNYVHASRLIMVEQLDQKRKRKIFTSVFGQFLTVTEETDSLLEQHDSNRSYDSVYKRSNHYHDLLVEALKSFASAWIEKKDTTLAPLFFEVVAASNGSASEERAYQVARIAKADPVLFRRLLCREDGYIRDEVNWAVSAALEMYCGGGGYAELLPGDEKKIMRVLYEPCVFDNPDNLEKIRSVRMKKEIGSIIYEGMDWEEVPSPAMSGLSKTKEKAGTGKNQLTVSGFGYVFTLAKDSFRPEEHHLFYHQKNAATLSSIDGKMIWGTDGSVPKHRLRYLRVAYGAVSYTLFAGAVAALYEPALTVYPDSDTHHVEVFRSGDGQRVYLRMMGGDGAGGYVTVWIFRDGVYKGRVVEHGF